MYNIFIQFRYKIQENLTKTLGRCCNIKNISLNLHTIQIRSVINKYIYQEASFEYTFKIYF